MILTQYTTQGRGRVAPAERNTMGLFDFLWPEPEPGDMLEPEPPEIEPGDLVSFNHYGGIYAAGVVAEIGEDSFGEVWLYIRYADGAFGATWRAAGHVELLEKAMRAA